MKSEIEKLIKKSVELYEKNKLIIGLNIEFSNSNLASYFLKGTYNKAWLISKRDMEFMELVEGDMCPVHRYYEILDECTHTVFNMILSFLKQKNVPVKLNIFIDSRENKFDVCLVELK